MHMNSMTIRKTAAHLIGQSGTFPDVLLRDQVEILGSTFQHGPVFVGQYKPVQSVRHFVELRDVQRVS